MEAQRIGRRVGSRKIHHEAEIVVPVDAATTGAVGRGDVVGHHLPLTYGVLSGHRGDLARPSQIRYGGGVTARIHLRMTRHREVLVDLKPAVTQLQTQIGDRGDRGGPRRTRSRTWSPRTGDRSGALPRPSLGRRTDRCSAVPLPHRDRRLVGAEVNASVDDVWPDATTQQGRRQARRPSEDDVNVGPGPPTAV